MGASSPQYKAMDGCIRSFMLKHFQSYCYSITLSIIYKYYFCNMVQLGYNPVLSIVFLLV